jgi:hypothetical protein
LYAERDEYVPHCLVLTERLAILPRGPWTPRCMAGSDGTPLIACVHACAFRATVELARMAGPGIVLGRFWPDSRALSQCSTSVLQCIGWARQNSSVGCTWDLMQHQSMWQSGALHARAKSLSWTRTPWQILCPKESFLCCDGGCVAPGWSDRRWRTCVRRWWSGSHSHRCGRVVLAGLLPYVCTNTASNRVQRCGNVFVWEIVKMFDSDSFCLNLPDFLKMVIYMLNNYIYRYVKVNRHQGHYGQFLANFTVSQLLNQTTLSFSQFSSDNSFFIIHSSQYFFWIVSKYSCATKRLIICQTG